jgi:phosphoenolpyruvate carboxykinase (GTP)
MTNHAKLNAWVQEMAAMCQPDKVVWIDGSDAQREQLTAEAVASGELIKLNQKKHPGCYFHRTAKNDVARTEHLTYICTPKQEDVGPTNNWLSPEEGYRRAGEIFKGSMKGRTMYVIPFSLGPVGSVFSKYGVELTDSIYVVLNMLIMVRCGQAILDKLGTDGEFTKCLHGKADLNENRRLILHFPQDNTVWSVGSGYGGNVLLSKKCMALRLASCAARKESWLAEHMLILGIEDPQGRIDYIAAAFPSACGKTNLAMLVPPESMTRKGYRVWTVGDDIAWMRVDTDGALWGLNPETGMFGVAPGTNSKTNPHAIATVRRNTIFTNVLLTENKTVWWEDGDGNPPAKGVDWKGDPWTPDMRDADGKPVLGAHPNARFTTPLAQCPSHTYRMEHHHGVPIAAIIFGGRRARLAPLVYQAYSWQHGVFIGATMASERTAAQYGKQGEVRRDPMAMLPFCGYNMAEYFTHWLQVGQQMTKPPKVFHVNWFRQDMDGQYLWPGYGENLRVLEWILGRCRGEAEAVATPVGYVPTPESLDLGGLDLPEGVLQELLTVDRKAWLQETEDISEFFEKFNDRLPHALRDELDSVKRRLAT